MFRTDFNHWLQGFESDGLTFFMKFISLLGLSYPIMLATLLILAAVNIKKGIILINIVAITAALTVWLKEYIDYPRPIAVDSSLLQFDEEKTSQDYSHLQPTKTFEFFSDEILVNTRGFKIGRQGLPSGHTSIQTALWLGLALLFGGRWLWVTSIAVVVFTAFSRMYLGVHYPGDIIGGLFLGLFVLALVTFLARKLKVIDKVVVDNSQVFFYLFPAIFIIFLPASAAWQLGLLLGINVGVLVISHKKPFPELSSQTRYKVMSAVVLILFFFILFFAAKFMTTLVLKGFHWLIYYVVGLLVVYSWLSIGMRNHWIIQDENI